MLSVLKSIRVAAICCGLLVFVGRCVAQAPLSPSFDATAGYTYEHSNAPAGSCGCFSLNGGFASFAYNAPHSLSYVAEVLAAHGSNVGVTPQAITYTNVLVGARYSEHRFSHLFTPYGQVLLGGAHESSTVAQANGLTAFAFNVGGGAAVRLTEQFSLNLLQIDWLYSRLYNGTNSYQNTLGVSTGVTFRFGKKPTS